MANKQSKVDSLEERISKLVAENDILRQENTEIKSENIELKTENAKLKQALKEHESRFMKLEQNDKDTASENAKLKARVAKLEQNFEHRLENGDNSSENIANVPNPVIDQCIDTNSKSLEDKEMNNFLDEKNKEKVSNEIRQRNKERKLLRESDKNQSQDLSSVNHNISPDILCNTEIINEQDSRKQKKEKDLIQEILLEKNHINENLSSDQKSTRITNAEAFSLRETSDNCKSRPYRAKNIINLYQNACNAEESAMKANQEEILCWCLYAKGFKYLVRDFMTKYNIGEKKAKGLVYDFIIEQLPNTKRENLCKQTQRAIKIFNLFEKIGTDKVQYIKTYSANSISKFTNEELQKVIDYFSSNYDNCSTEISTTSGLSNHVTEIPESSSESIPIESQVSDSSSSKPSQENDQDESKTRSSASLELPEAKVNASTEETKSQVSDSSISANSSEVSMPPISQVNVSNKSRPSISVLPGDPEKKQAHVIKMVLERFSYLTLKHNFKYSNYFDFNRSVLCPICNKDHKKENIRNNIEGLWGSGDYVNTKTYHLYCYINKYQNSIPIVTVKA
ncbi:hypothetical protein C2G38_2202369 [Gigaspora rosea]|uniref:Uncharacterized protein n=1 Tax=Gigaspora rosea TaxID=44941 RepID=A0A397UNN4_9GLOM|nr:hypothetical protein C2G38_2202369 [Gigaspora rosea]